MSARRVAAKILTRVLEQDAYAAAALSSAFSAGEVSSKDRGLVTELVYGVLRTQGALTRLLKERGKVKESDTIFLCHLLIGAYQIEFLDRVPTHAAVYEAVEAVQDARGRRVGGFANAVLRGLADRPADQRLDFRTCVLQSFPSWLRKRLIRDVGEENAVELLAPAISPRPYLRVTNEVAIPWLSELATSCDGVEGAYLFEGGGDPRRLEGFAEGAFVVQELGAQLVGYALGARPGESVLDACAGRGQKTSLLAAQVGSNGSVVATDLHGHKVSALAEEMSRVGAKVEARTWDWTAEPPLELRAAFDRVIVDAPCTGVGTLRRRPEIARRLTSNDPKRLAELQFRIVENAAQAVRPGGTLLFATCSVLREEAEAVSELLRENGLLVPVVPSTPVDSALFGEGEARPELRLLPNVHGTDGYFVSRFQRRLD